MAQPAAAVRRGGGRQCRAGGDGLRRPPGLRPARLGPRRARAGGDLRRRGRRPGLRRVHRHRRAAPGAGGGPGASEGAQQTAPRPQVIRVLQVLEATEGGTLEHLRQLVPGLDPRRFTSAVAVGLSRGPGAAPVLDGFRAAGVRVEVGPLQRAPHLTRDAAALAWLRGLLRSGDFDLVHTHAAKAGFLARLAAHIEGVPAVYAPHGWPFLNPEFPPALRRAYASLERLAAGWCQRIIAVSPGEAQDALDWRIARPDQLAVAPNGVDVAALRALPAATRA
ncbi:MAG TPA: hypothetical protein DCZ72_05870 [Armatimonadetes bacterium]|nr:hypothetical protein [Armatimonadota bacterium]